MTVNQRKKLALKRKQWFMVPEKSLSPNQTGLITRIVSHKLFDLYSIILLLFNTISWSVYSHSPKVEHWSHTFADYASLVLIAGFVIEIGLQIFAYRKAYFQKSWNVFNFVLVNGILLTHFTPFIEAYFVSSFFLFWLLTFRLLRWLKWVKRIVLMFRICWPAISNVADFTAIIMFFFAATAVQLYWHLQPHEIHNFYYIFSAYSVLIEIGFFGAWDSVYSALHDGEHFAALFVVNYLIICFFIFITAGTVIFLENYSHINEKLRLGIQDENFENYRKMWQIFDPDATGSMTFDDLSDFLHYLDPPLQVEKPNDLKITAMQFPVNKNNKVKFSDVLQNLIYHLDKEKKVPKPILEEDEEEKVPTSSSRLVEMREKAAQLHKSTFWCCQKKKSTEENEELTTD